MRAVVRALMLLPAMLALCAVAGTARAARAAGCATPILSLEQITRQASTAVIAQVTAESGDAADGYSSTLRIEGTLKGVPPGPAMKLSGLGHPGGACDGGPRLTQGNVYVLFLTKLDDAPATQATYGLTDGDESVYTLTESGTIFPAQKAGGSPELQPIAPAEFARDVGDVAGADQARIENVIAALSLPETVGGAPAPATITATSSGPPRWLPSRNVMLGVGVGALLLALLIGLLWQPRAPRLR